MAKLRCKNYLQKLESHPQKRTLLGEGWGLRGNCSAVGLSLNEPALIRAAGGFREKDALSAHGLMKRVCPRLGKKISLGRNRRAEPGHTTLLVPEPTSCLAAEQGKAKKGTGGIGIDHFVL